MLTNYELSILYKCLLFVTKLKLVEIEIDKTTLVVKVVTERRFTKWLGSFLLVVYIANVILLCLRFFTTDVIAIQVVAMLLAVTTMSMISFRITLMLYSHELAQLANNIFALNQKLAESDDESSRPGPLVKTKRAYIYALVVSCICNCAVGGSIQNILINFSMFSNVLEYFTYGTLLCVYTVSVVCDITTCVGIFVPSVVTVASWLRKACADWATLTKSAEFSIHIYRSMQILNYLQNLVFGSFFLPAFKLVLMLCLFISIFCIVRLRQWLPILVYLMTFFYTFTLVTVLSSGAMVMSMVYNISLEFNQNSKRSGRRQNLEIGKTFRSIPVLKCTVGGFYHMEGKAKLTLMDNIANGIAGSLLSVSSV